MFSRLGSIFVLLAVVVPYVSATSSSSCNKGEFYYGEKDCCLKSGGAPSAPAKAPTGASCPSTSENWYWSGEKSCCLPSYEPKPTTPSCPSGYSWQTGKSMCARTTPTTPSSSCSSSEFWWTEKECCLPSGGMPSAPSPPSGSSCPSSGWYWHPGQKCCVPKTPSPPSPSCPSGWTWSSWACIPKFPVPSGKWKRAMHKSRSVSLCPKELEACPVSGLRGLNGSVDYECLDTTSELESCGGCASMGKGQDCTAIKGAWNVGCNKGACTIYTCAAGFKLAADGQSCLAL